MSSTTGFAITNGELIKYYGPGGEVIIPDCVTSIGSGAFTFCDKVTSITIPDGVKSIGTAAFSYCAALTSITIPDSVTTIGESAFYNCSRMTHVTIPSGATSINRCAFFNCSNLTSIIIPTGAKSIGERAFYNCSSLKNVIISEGVARIEKFAFYGCSNLENFTIPDSMTSIGDSAFYGCSSLTSIVMPDNVVEMGNDVFWGCSLLSKNNVKLPQSFIDIADSTYAHLGLGDENGCIIEGDTLIRHVRTDAVIHVTEGIVKIANGAFPDVANIRQIVLPDSVRSIDDSKVFKELKEMNIPSGYLQQSNTLPAGATAVLLTKAWAKKASIMDYVCLYLFQKKTTILSICQKKLSASPDESVRMFLLIPQTDLKKTSYSTIADFLMQHIQSISPGTIKAFYETAAAAKATKAAELIKPYVEETTSELQPSPNGTGSNPKQIPASSQDLNSREFNIAEGTLLAYMGSADSISVPFGVIEIAGGGLYRKGKRLQSVILPDSVRNIHRNAFIIPAIAKSRFEHVPSLRDQRISGMPSSMNIPKGYFEQRKGTFDLDMAILLLSCGPWKKEATFDDYAGICANQTNTELLDICFKRFTSKPSEALDKLITRLEKNRTKDLHERTAHFALKNLKNITQEQMSRLFKVTKSAGATTVLKLLEQYAPTEPSKQADKPIEQVTTLEEKLRKNRTPYDLDTVLKRAQSMDSYSAKCVFDEFDFSGVKYANSDEEVSPFVLKYVIASYVEQLEARPKRGHMYCDKFRFCAEADKAAATFEARSFQNLVDRIELCHETVAVKCRFGSEKEIVHIGAMINKGERDRKDTFHIVAIEAIVLSDTRRAMIIADEHDLLGRYARMRHTTAEVIRETKLLDFGLSDAYTKFYDIGNTLIQAKLNRDLSLSLYDVNGDKIVKTFPKKGADPDKLQEATDDLSDLKKNIKKVIGNRKKELFLMFLSGETIPVAKWKLSYISNPVFHRLAETIVWSQGKDSFILTESGAICSDGSEYLIKDNAAIGLAHPLLMEDREPRSWQRYISSQSIKQPFIQMWEPTPARYDIRPDRYVGCMLPYYRFLHREEHGITTFDFDFHNDIEIELTDCNAKIERIDWHRHEISPDDRFEIKSIELKSKYSLMGNHVIAYLDRITMYGRILADDVTISDQLNSCNIAQITNYIQCAQEAKATNVLALLIDYKSKAFPDFDPMAEFKIEW